MLAITAKTMIVCKPHLRFCNVPVVHRQPARVHQKRLNAPRIRISATFQSEEADDFDFVEDSDVRYQEDFEHVEERQSGVVKWFNNKKGFGFITKADGSGDIFVHQSNITSSGYRSLREGEAVEFDEMISEDDRATATNVTGPDGREPLVTPPSSHLDLLIVSFRAVQEMLHLVSPSEGEEEEVVIESIINILQNQVLRCQSHLQDCNWWCSTFLGLSMKIVSMTSLLIIMQSNVGSDMMTLADRGLNFEIRVLYYFCF